MDEWVCVWMGGFVVGVGAEPARAVNESAGIISHMDLWPRGDDRFLSYQQ